MILWKKNRRKGKRTDSIMVKRTVLRDEAVKQVKTRTATVIETERARGAVREGSRLHLILLWC